jgi:hypothetical protein
MAVAEEVYVQEQVLILKLEAELVVHLAVMVVVITPLAIHTVQLQDKVILAVMMDHQILMPLEEAEEELEVQVPTAHIV